jgi:predicted permease
VLGVRTAIGSTITSEDDEKPGAGGARGPVVVISHALWMRKFGGSAAVVGSRILLNGQPFTVVGVALQGFSGTEVGEWPDVYAPMMMQEVLVPMKNALAQPLNNWLRIMGRLKRGMDAQQAEAEMTTLLRRFHAEFWRDARADRRRRLAEQRIALRPGNAGLSGLRGQYSKPLWVLMAAMVLVLLIACANVANLLLSRAAARRREIAMRLGLGAARSRLVSQLLTESLMLALAGAASGLLLARWMRDVLLGYLPPQQHLPVPLDGSVLLFSGALAAGAAVLFGLAPAIQGTRIDLAPALKSDGPVLKRNRAFFRHGLVVLQVSLSFVLLLGAALFLRSLQNLLTIDPGFARLNVVVATIGFASADRMKVLYSHLLEQATALPSVTSAALADSPPLGTHTGWEVWVPGFAPKRDAPSQSPSVAFVSPGYFATMNIPVLIGRDFEARDMGSRRNVLIVNETFARYYFEGRNPVGSMVGLRPGVHDFEIVGVVKDGKYTGLREEAIRMMYVPQEPIISSSTVLHLRTSARPCGPGRGADTDLTSNIEYRMMGPGGHLDATACPYRTLVIDRGPARLGA